MFGLFIIFTSLASRISLLATYFRPNMYDYGLCIVFSHLDRLSFRQRADTLSY